MNLSELQKVVFHQIDQNRAEPSFYKTKDIHKRLHVYHRGMKSRIKQAITADFEDSLLLLKNFNELFEEFFKSIEHHYFSLSEYYHPWNQWVQKQHSVSDNIKALIHFEALQQDSYFRAYNLFNPAVCFSLEQYQVKMNPSLLVESFEWDVANNPDKKSQCHYSIWTEQSTVYTETIEKQEYGVLKLLLNGNSLEQSLSPIENIYKKSEILNWIQNSMHKWSSNNWLSLLES